MEQISGLTGCGRATRLEPLEPPGAGEWWRRGARRRGICAPYRAGPCRQRLPPSPSGRAHSTTGSTAQPRGPAPSLDGQMKQMLGVTWLHTDWDAAAGTDPPAG